MAVKNKISNNIPKKVWYKTWWKSVIGAITVCGVVWGIFEIVIKVNKEWEDYQEFKNRLELLEKDAKNQDSLINANKTYIEKKKGSYAVGFRVVTEWDDDLNMFLKKRKYRDWSGETYIVHKDEYYSNHYGYDYFFYIDKTGEKKYCY